MCCIVKAHCRSGTSCQCQGADCCTEFASTLRQARRLGSVTSYLPGAGKLSDPVQSANLLQYERIIE